MLVADKMKRPVRQATAIALVSVGAFAAVPLWLGQRLSELIGRSRSAAAAIGSVPFAVTPVTFRDGYLLIADLRHADCRQRPRLIQSLRQD